MNTKRILVLCLVVVGLISVTVWAQQPVDLTRISGSVPIYDPCFDPTKRVPVNINQSAASTTVELVAVSGSTRIYLCDGKVQGSAAGEIGVLFGSGTTCGSTQQLLDTTTVTNAGDGGLLLSGGAGSIARSASARALCMSRSASMTLEGHIVYVQE